jgi:hypothetical protein
LSWDCDDVSLNVGIVSYVVGDIASGIGRGVCWGIGYMVSWSIGCNISSGIDWL